MTVDVLIFTQDKPRFAKSLLTSGRGEMVTQPSELIEATKNRVFPIVLFDTAHPEYSEPLVLRTHRRLPAAEFWLLGNGSTTGLPDYVISGVIPHSITKQEFDSRLKATLRIRNLLEQYQMIGRSDNLKRTAEMISQAAPTNISTLIIGPSGSGKELVARALHNYSVRNKKVFTAINCGALTESLLESELFGYERGAFTGAIGKREGLFKRSDGGTVFLDEIGEMSPGLQVKLLRVLEEGSFYRVGGGDLVQVDVRIVAATNRELTEAIGDRGFREDLYFRLGGVRINLIGLDRRRADILPLINHFFVTETGATRGVSRRATDLLLEYGWPGNIRQLRNFVNRMIMIGGSGELSETMVLQFIEEQGFTNRNLPVVTGKSAQEAEFQLIYQALLSLGQEVRMLRDLILDQLPSSQDVIVSDFTPDADSTSTKTVEEVEQELIEKTLQAVGGNRRKAAEKLGIGERTLYRKLKKQGDR